MGVQVVKKAREKSKARGATFSVLLYLADRVFDKEIENERAALTWPSQGNIAKETRWAVRTVQRALDELVALGEIEAAGWKGSAAHLQTRVWSVLPEYFEEEG